MQRRGLPMHHKAARSTRARSMHTRSMLTSLAAIPTPTIRSSTRSRMMPARPMRHRSMRRWRQPMRTSIPAIPTHAFCPTMHACHRTRGHPMHACHRMRDHPMHICHRTRDPRRTQRRHRPALHWRRIAVFRRRLRYRHPNFSRTAIFLYAAMLAACSPSQRCAPISAVSLPSTAVNFCARCMARNLPSQVPSFAVQRRRRCGTTRFAYSAMAISAFRPALS